MKIPTPLASKLASQSGTAHRETLDLLHAYEKRFLQALIKMPSRRPWIEAERQEILACVQNCLGIRESWVPKVTTKIQAVTQRDGFVIEHHQAQSWPDVHSAADLYLPEHANADADAEKLPVVLLACGHGQGGKRAQDYRRMAEHLARHRIAVLVSDNIGQGERIAMGHRDVVEVFACGLSLQGLIVMENMGWLRWLKSQPRFDSQKIALIGNSGGGTLSLFLGALCVDELAAVSSSGYPCTFDFVARKEKKHCHCNILPHIVGELEMWQIYGCIAPKPLLLFQGMQDQLFPYDLFRQTSRKVAAVYEHASAGGEFESCITEGGHSWDAQRHHLLTRFLCQTLTVAFDESRIDETDPLPDLPACHPQWPLHARTADDLARHLTGRQGEPAEHLWDVFRPPHATPHAMPKDTHLPLLQTDLRQIISQFEAFLKK